MPSLGAGACLLALQLQERQVSATLGDTHQVEIPCEALEAKRAERPTFAASAGEANQTKLAPVTNTVQGNIIKLEAVSRSNSL